MPPGERDAVTGDPSPAFPPAVAHLRDILPALAGDDDGTAELVLAQVRIYGGSMSLRQRISALFSLLSPFS